MLALVLPRYVLIVHANFLTSVAVVSMGEAKTAGTANNAKAPFGVVLVAYTNF